MTAISDLSSWIFGFRQTRKAIPHGSPLWAYKVSDVELDELQTLLSHLPLSLGIRRVINFYEGQYSEVFVLFAATWLQRNNSGRAKWEPLLSAINAVDLDPNDRMSLVARGLRKWGLTVFSTDTTNRYLDSLTCQGGFPRSDLLQQSASHIMEYFEAVLSLYERYQHSTSLEDLAVKSLSILPITLRQTAFAELVTRLIDCLLEWKAHYNLGVYADAVKILDNENRTWRQELPFLVLDEEAKTLINTLLKRASTFKRRELNPIRVKRQLVPVGDDYRLTADVYIAKEIHPEDLARQLGGQALPTVFLLSTQTCDGNRFRTASFTLRTGFNGGWQVSSYYTSVKNSLAAGELSFSVDSDGRHILDATYYRGEALSENMPWVFELSGTTINYIGQGSIKSNKDRLVIVSSSRPSAANVIAKVSDGAQLIGTDLSVYEVFGEVEVEALSGKYRISCNSGENEEFKIKIDSPEYVEVHSKHPVYRGVPIVTFKQSDEVREVSPDQLFWFQKGSKSITPLTEDTAIGFGVLVWRKDGFVLWERPCVILPEQFDYRLNHVGGIEFSLILRNARQPKIGMMPGCENWLEVPPSYEVNEIRLDFVPKDPAAEAIGVSLVWDENRDTEIEVEFPISLNIVTVTDRRGIPYRELERGSLTINYLINLKLTVRTDNKIEEIQLVVNLYGKPAENDREVFLMADRRTVTVDWVGGVSQVRGSELAAIANRLFGLTDQLESYLRVAVYAGGENILINMPKINRYKHDPQFVDNYTAFTLKPTPTLLSIESPALHLSPIWDFDRDPIEIEPVDKSANVWRFELPAPSEIEYGGWLIWGDAEMSVHPRIKNYAIPRNEQDPTKVGTIGAKLLSAMCVSSSPTKVYEETLKPGTLSYKVKYLDIKDPESLKSLNKSIRKMGFDIDHPDWEYIDGVMKRIDSLAPLSLFAMTSLQRNFGALVALLFRYRGKFDRSWEIAEQLGITWYSVPPAIWLNVIKQYFAKFKKEAEPIRQEISEEAYWEYVCHRFQPLANKGKYFEYLINLATERFPAWDDEYIKANGLSIQAAAFKFNQERAALIERHKNELLSRVGTKGTTEKFITDLNRFWPSGDLPPLLSEFVEFAHAPYRGIRTKQAWTLTIAVPLKLGFCLSGFYQVPRQSRIKLMLGQIISRLDEFDREWLQKALIISHMACDLFKLEESSNKSINSIETVE